MEATGTASDYRHRRFRNGANGTYRFRKHHTPIIDTITLHCDAQLTTLMTTNLPSKKIAEKYGERIVDRLNEMCVKIVFKE